MLQLCTDRIGVAVGCKRDDGTVTQAQEPVLLGGYAAKRCPVRVQNDFLPLVQTLKWVPSPEDQARLDAGNAFEASVFEDLAAFHPAAVLVDSRRPLSTVNLKRQRLVPAQRGYWLVNTQARPSDAALRRAHFNPRCGDDSDRP